MTSRLFTSSYRAWRPELGVPVRTSLGAPRWMQAPLVEWRSVYPWGLLTRPRLEPEEFTRRYRHRLHQRTPRILAELQELREGYGDVVLCCHEPAGAFCHRRVLAAWLEEKLGEPVEEVSEAETGAPAPLPDP